MQLTYLSAVILAIAPFLVTAYPVHYSSMPYLAPRDAEYYAERIIEARDAAIENEIQRIVERELELEEDE